jgi:hypothetical protein
MIKFVTVFVMASVALCVGTAQADVDDCIDHMVSRGVSARDARQACSKASDGNRSNNLNTEARKFCTTAQKGNGETLRYSNGQVMTNYAGRKGASWYYPNGKLMTNYAGQEGVSWYYSNGKLMTHYAGRKGASWYYPNGQLITHYMSEVVIYPCDYLE